MPPEHIWVSIFLNVILDYSRLFPVYHRIIQTEYVEDIESKLTWDSHVLVHIGDHRIGSSQGHTSCQKAIMIWLVSTHFLMLGHSNQVWGRYWKQRLTCGVHIVDHEIGSSQGNTSYCTANILWFENLSDHWDRVQCGKNLKSKHWERLTCGGIHINENGIG